MISLSVLALFFVMTCNVLGQSNQTSSTGPLLNNPYPTSTTSYAGNVITTTITSLVPQSSGPSSTWTLLLTLTLNNTAIKSSSANLTTSPTPPMPSIAGNMSMTNGTDTNSTLVVPWNSTDSWLPFNITLDPAFGVAGGIMIASGLPVAVLGGKNKWSSLAIVSGYALSLFCLVMILSFGVEPALQPPSPNPPSEAMRGLYVLAAGISGLIGAGLGIFFYSITGFGIGAAGGFSFAWFLLATRTGGLVTTIAARWGLLGGCTVVGLLTCFVPQLHSHILLVSTAWIGATVLTLGIDCFTRTGLKEFYIYNLGYASLFASLNGEKYPLTQSMAVELGVIAAVALIGGAIQLRIVIFLQKRMDRIQADDEAKFEADEVNRAAERFKNVEVELGEWEETHGNSLKPLPEGFSGVTRGLENETQISSIGLLSGKRKPLYESIPGESTIAPVQSSGGRGSQSEGCNFNTITNNDGSTALASPNDPELEKQLLLLAEVQQARRDIRSSIDQIRSRSSSTSLGSVGAEHRLSMTSNHLLDFVESSGPSDCQKRVSVPGNISNESCRPYSATSDQLDSMVSRGPPPSDWEVYVQERKIMSHSSLPNAIPKEAPISHTGDYAIISDAVAQALSRRKRMTDTSVSDQRQASAQPLLTETTTLQSRSVSDGKGVLSPEYPSNNRTLYSRGSEPLRSTQSPRRSMTFDQFTDRHRTNLSRMQEQLNKPMREEMVAATAREQWEHRRRDERNKMLLREHQGDHHDRGHRPEIRQSEIERSDERIKSTDQWRKSIIIDA